MILPFGVHTSSEQRLWNAVSFVVISLAMELNAGEKARRDKVLGKRLSPAQWEVVRELTARAKPVEVKAPKYPFVETPNARVFAEFPVGVPCGFCGDSDEVVWTSEFDLPVCAVCCAHRGLETGFSTNSTIS